MNWNLLRKGGFLVTLLIALALTGCWLQLPVGFESAPPASTQSCVLADATSATSPLGAESGGRLAYIGTDGNVYVTTADGRSTVAITDDASAFPEKQGYSYHRISWSPEGWLAFAAVTRQGDAARGELYVTDSPGCPARLVAENNQHFISYIYWSQVPCPGQPYCQRLAYLTPEDPQLGTGLHLLEIDANGVENRLLAIARPFYFSWSSDGSRMLWHTGAAELTLYDVDLHQARALPHTSDGYLAPVCSSAGENWLVVSADGGQNCLKSFDPQGNERSITTTQGDVVFSWSPSGREVAYAVRSRDVDQMEHMIQKPGLDRVYGPIYVFDHRTGEKKQVSKGVYPVLGFVWAPDGQRLAYLARINQTNDVLTQWRIVDPDDATDHGFAIFDPSPWMRRIIPRLSQYAQSHRFWSPDGRYLVYSDRDDAKVDRVWLVDTLDHNRTEAILVAEGVIGIWSWE
jgi:Tol biopolymer transport system component